MKKFYLVLITFLIGINSVFAAPKTMPRTDDDLGVNKNFNITEENIGNVKRTPRVDASEKIYDFAEILIDSEEKKLYQKISNYIEKTNMDMVILTTDLEYLDDELEDYAADFYDYNDFGIDFDKYSGLLLIINMNSYNRFFNVYTFGMAQAYYDYNTCEAILDYMFDDIKAGYYFDGFSQFISSAEDYFKRGPNENIYIDDDGYAYYKRTYNIPWGIAIIISGIATIITMIVLIKKNRMIKKETLAGIYIDKNSIKYNNMVDQFLHSHTSSYTVSSNSSSGGSISHSGSSGGGHGGGGGRHF